MEQFHASPTNQWNVITRMIDECDFYLLVIGGRYGSIDEETGKSYTEKEYDYAKGKGLPVLVLIKKESAITENIKDTSEDHPAFICRWINGLSEFIKLSRCTSH